jgi:hypothetical protein
LFFTAFISEWETPTWPPSIQMWVIAGIFLASILLKEMRYLVYIRYLWHSCILGLRSCLAVRMSSSCAQSDEAELNMFLIGSRKQKWLCELCFLGSVFFSFIAFYCYGQRLTKPVPFRLHNDPLIMTLEISQILYTIWTYSLCHSMYLN